MSDKDNHPAQRDTARPVTPVIFDGQDDTHTRYTDFRAVITPADAEVDDGPKDSSARGSAPSSESPKTTAETVPEKPAPAAAAKANGPAKGQSSGSSTSSSLKTPGKPAAPAVPGQA